MQASWVLLLFLARLSSQMSLQVNSGASFTLSHGLHRRSSNTFTFVNRGQLLRDVYAVINFNGFDAANEGRLPSVTITSFAHEQDINNAFYFSNRKADWTFDENLLVVPLNSAEKFEINVSPRSSQSPSVDGIITIFQGSKVAIDPNFFMPLIVREDLSQGTVEVYMDGIGERESRKKLFIRPCHGRIKSVVMYDGSSQILKTEDPALLKRGLDVPKIDSKTLKIQVNTDGSVSGDFVAKVGLISYDPNLTMLDQVFEYSPRVWNDNAVIRWTGLDEAAIADKLNYNTMIYIDSDPAVLKFKMECGFHPSLLKTGGSKSALHKDMSASGSHNNPEAVSQGYEFSFNSSALRTETNAVNLTAELPFRYGEEKADILTHEFHYYVKQVFFASSNTAHHTFYYLTAASSSLEISGYSEEDSGLLGFLWRLFYKSLLVLSMVLFFGYRCKVKKLQLVRDMNQAQLSEENKKRSLIEYSKIEQDV